MGILNNPRHERFAQEMAKGKTATESYLAAGYDISPEMATRAASRLSRNVAVRARIEEILGKAATRAEITKADVLKELAKIGFANMADYMCTTEQGDPYLDFSNLDRDQTAALVEVTVEDFKDGRGEDARDVRRVKFKLADKRAALVDIGRHLGMFVEKHEFGGVGAFSEMPDADLMREIGERAKTLGLAVPRQLDS